MPLFLILAFLAIALGTIVTILIEAEQTGEVIFSTSVPGGVRGTRSVSADLEKSELSHVLIVTPDVESGWGEPDIYMTLKMIAPGGEILVSVERDELWGGLVSETNSRDYTQKFTFAVAESGEYTIELKIYTDHVEDVSIKIGQKRN